MPVRLITGLMILAAAGPAFAQDDAAQRQRDADRAIQDSLRNIDRYEQQQRTNALDQRVQNLEAQRQQDADLRALQAQAPAPPIPIPVPRPIVQTQPSTAFSNSTGRISPFAPVQPDIGTASEARRRAAADSYAVCLTRAAGSLDDQISDAATIAVVIEPSCAREFDGWKTTLEDGTARDARIALEQSLNASRQSAAIQAVLQARQTAAPARRN